MTHQKATTKWTLIEHTSVMHGPTNGDITILWHSKTHFNSMIGNTSCNKAEVSVILD